MYSSIEIVYNEKSIIKRPITIMISCLQQWQNDKNDIEKKKKKTPDVIPNINTTQCRKQYKTSLTETATASRNKTQ